MIINITVSIPLILAPMSLLVKVPVPLTSNLGKQKHPFPFCASVFRPKCEVPLHVLL